MSTIRAFMYHDIRDLKDTTHPRRYALRSFLNWEVFEKQIKHISRKYTIIDTKDIFDLQLRDGDEDYAVLTFDDGLLDHYHVYKYLKNSKLPASFFVPVEAVTLRRTINSHKIQFILAACDESALVNEILSHFNDKEALWDTYCTTKWKDNWWSKEMIFVTNFLRRHEAPGFDSEAFCDRLFKKHVTADEQSFSKSLYLSTEQVAEMARDGYTIGGHGYSSNNLLSGKRVEFEIEQSRTFVRTFSDFLCFSYPNGGYDLKIVELLDRMDFKLSYTVQPMTLTDLDKISYLEFPRYDAPQRVGI